MAFNAREKTDCGYTYTVMNYVLEDEESIVERRFRAIDCIDIDSPLDWSFQSFLWNLICYCFGNA